MNPQQKHALFTLATMALTAAAALAIGAATGDPYAAMAGFAVIAALPLGRRLFSRGDTPARDERDDEIARRASLVGYAVFWLCFIGAGVLGPHYLGLDTAMPVRQLVLVPWVGVWILYVARSAATLTFYARGL